MAGLTRFGRGINTATVYGMKEVITWGPVDFSDAAAQTSKIRFPYKARVDRITACVTEANASTCAATISFSDGNAYSASVTIAASAAVNYYGAATPTAHNVIAADGYAIIKVAQTTVTAGKAIVALEVTRLY